MQADQLNLGQIHLADCPFAELLEEDDNHCLSFDPRQKNEVLSCDNPKTYKFLAQIGNVGFNSIVAEPTPNIRFPSFIPSVTHGSRKMLAGNNLPYIAATLHEVVSPKKLSVTKDIRKTLGASQKSKIVLLSYGRDELIEKVWPKRHTVFKEIARLDLQTITGVNYSVWLKDPHAERLINPKRSLMTFAEMQGLGMPAIPHIYWSGKKDLVRWTEWLDKNSGVSIVAIDLQTEREEPVWLQTINDLAFFISKLSRPVHFLITGPKNPCRIRDLQTILPSFTLTNGYAALMAWASQMIKEVNGRALTSYSKLPKNEIFMHNVNFYKQVLISMRKLTFLHNFNLFSYNYLKPCSNYNTRLKTF